MSHNLLKGKKGIIFGALDEKSIAWITAIKSVFIFLIGTASILGAGGAGLYLGRGRRHLYL